MKRTYDVNLDNYSKDCGVGDENEDWAYLTVWTLSKEKADVTLYLVEVHLGDAVSEYYMPNDGTGLAEVLLFMTSLLPIIDRINEDSK